MFDKILIANRGEIAVRIISAAKAMGIRTVAVYSEADADAMHVRRADESVCIGPAPARQSYLDIDAILKAAREFNVDAVHPGYGFLSESPDFAAAVQSSGFAFIGPTPGLMALMGDKVSARSAAIAAGVPVLPGSDGAIESVDDAAGMAESIGFPVAVKACHGGGGRGLRVAQDAGALAQAIESAQREALAAFGRSEIFLERYLSRPRHVEVQIVGDGMGNVIHLGDRDCTVQRRHQKMIEEAPAPNLPADLRSALREAAVALARSVGFVSAGTVEFLVDAKAQSFFFLEMNTRLQVEHGVTELVTGVDLVETQIRIAAGQPLDLAQDGVVIRGHAIQTRILAENPWEGFNPTPGTIDKLTLPQGPWLRCDFGVEAGDAAQPHYDSLIGKLLAWGKDRETAIRRLRQAIAIFNAGGIFTTAGYLDRVLAEPEFLDCLHHTGSVEADWYPSSQDRPDQELVPEEKSEATDRIIERQVRLPGPPQRTIAIFGKEQRSGSSAHQILRRRSEAVEEAQGRNASRGIGSIVSPMDGLLVELRVDNGQEVDEGATLAILEAMKMEMVIRAPVSGIVQEISAQAGQSVKKGQLLLVVE